MAIRNWITTWGNALNRFPIFANYAINSAVLLKCSGASRLAEIKYRDVLDITSMLLDTLRFSTLEAFLKSDEGRRFLRRLRLACTRRVSLWVGAVNRDTARHFSHLLHTSSVMDASLHPLPATDLTVRPWAISPARLLTDLCTHMHSLPDRQRDYILQYLAGMDITHMPGATRGALKVAGVPTVSKNLFMRTMLSPIFWTYVVVLIYSTLRVLPVSLVQEFHGSLVVLWTLDVATAIPYTWGVLAMLTAKTWSTRAVGIVTATVTFVAPYVYFALYGQGYPGYVILIVVGFIMAGVGLEGYKFWREHMLRKRVENVG